VKFADVELTCDRHENWKPVAETEFKTLLIEVDEISATIRSQVANENKEQFVEGWSQIWKILETDELWKKDECRYYWIGGFLDSLAGTPWLCNWSLGTSQTRRIQQVSRLL
jgi:hypothetical protein